MDRGGTEPVVIARYIAAAALKKIEDPANFTTGASARDAEGVNVAGATDRAVKWSGPGAVNAAAVALFTKDLEGWRLLATTLRDHGIDHYTPHAECVAALIRQEDV